MSDGPRIPCALVPQRGELVGLVFTDQRLNDGAEVALEIVGGAAVPPVLQQCLELLAPGGRLVILGYHYGQAFPIDPAQLVYKWIQIIASHNHSVQDVRDAASLVNDGRVIPVISELAPMQEANEAMDRLRAGDPIGRIVLEW